MIEDLRYLYKKIIFIVIFILLGYFTQSVYPPEIPNTYLDFMLITAFLALPYFFYGIASKNIFDIFLYLIKKIAMPSYILEQEVYSIKKVNIFLWLFYIFLTFLFLYNINTFNSLSTYLYKIRLPSVILSIASLFVKNIPFIFLIGFIYHVITVILVKNKSKIFVNVEKDLISVGDKTKIRIKFTFPVPVFNIFPYIKHEGKIKLKKLSLFSEEYEILFEAKETGFFLFSLFEIHIITFPLFFSKLYLPAEQYGKVIVYPKIKVKAIRTIRNPYVAREMGELIKKVYGSSLDFADIREYIAGDPISRIWWKGFAKTGKLLTKEFYSFAEDRWILLLDLTEKLTEEEKELLLSFVRLFIEVYTRKDIQISLHIFTKESYNFMDYTSNKKELLVFLTKYYKGLKAISTEGIKRILKQADIDLKYVEKVCGKEKISLSSYLLYNSLLKKEIEFIKLSRDTVLEKYFTDFLKNIKKYGKLVIITKKESDSYKRVLSKFSNYMIVSLNPIKNYRYILLKRPETVVYQLAYAF